VKRALLIASSEFSTDSGIEPLRFPLNDINAMAKTLGSHDFGFKVQKVVNEPASAAMRAIEEGISSSDYDDLLLIYFSGHGKLNRARDLFLSCADTDATRIHSTAIGYKWIIDVIQDHSLQKVAIILDCCYAGRAVAGSRGDTKGAIEEQVRAAVADPGSGIFFLGASGGNQTAEERESDGYGRFTKHIIEGLATGNADIDDDGSISARDLSTYVKRQLRRENAAQEPIEGGAFQGELIFGSNRRKQVEATISKVQARLLHDKNHFNKATFRKIEDYIDEVDVHSAIDHIINDRRYLLLKQYSSNLANVEQLAEAFRSEQQSQRDSEPALPTRAPVAPARASVAPAAAPAAASTAAPAASTPWSKMKAADVPAAKEVLTFLGGAALFLASIGLLLAGASSSSGALFMVGGAGLALCLVLLLRQTPAES
jgi:hypothetical protein